MTTHSSANDRERWNKKYASGQHTSDVPDTFFVDAYQEYVLPLCDPIIGKRALDVAAGTGRQGLWLAERGWTVTLVDIADRGLEIARRRASGRRLNVEIDERDLTTLSGAREMGWEASFDLIAVFFYLQRDLFPLLIDALKPGGLLIYKTYTKQQLRYGSGPTDPQFLLEPGELRNAFPALQLLFYRETIRETGVAELVARK